MKIQTITPAPSREQCHTTTQYAQFPRRAMSVTTLHASAANGGATVQPPLGVPGGGSIFVRPPPKVESIAEAEAAAEVEAPEEAKSVGEAEAPAEPEAPAQADARTEADALAEAQALAQADALAEADAQAEFDALAEAYALAESEARAEAYAPAEAYARAEPEAPAAELAEQPPVPSKPPVKRYGIVDIVGSAVGPAPHLDFVLPGLLRGNTGAIVAPGGSSKGNFAIGMALAGALGTEVCGGLLPAATGIRKTLIVQAEDDIPALSYRVHVWIEHTFQKPDIRKRFRTIKLLAQAVQEQFQMRAIRSSEAYLRNENDEPTVMLTRLREAGYKYDVIVLDPLRRLLRGNENDSETVTKFISELETISGKTGVSFLLVHHANKASTATGAGMSQNAIRGSSALTDALRYQLNMQTMSVADAKACKVEPSDAHRYVRVAMTKCNHSMLLPPAWAERLPGGVLEKVEFKPETDGDSEVMPRRAKKSSAGAKFVEELVDDE